MEGSVKRLQNHQQKKETALHIRTESPFNNNKNNCVIITLRIYCIKKTRRVKKKTSFQYFFKIL